MAARDQLESLLAGRDDWAALRAARAREGGAGVDTPDASLIGDPLFTAWQAINAAMAEITDLERRLIETPVTGGESVAQAPASIESADTSSPAATADAPAPEAPAQFVPAAIIHAAPPEAMGVVFAAPDGPPDELTRIRRIDAKTADALIALGVRKFAQIAQFNTADVRSLAAALDLGRRISRENWIEQAAILALRVQATAEPELEPQVRAPTAPVASTASEAEPVPAQPAEVPPPAAAPAVTRPPTIFDLVRAAADRIAAVSASPALLPPATPAEAPPARLPVHAPALATLPLRVPPSAGDEPEAAAETELEAVSESVSQSVPEVAVAAPMPEATPETVPEAVPAADVSASISTPAPDDELTLIRGIDAPTARLLAAFGYRRFADIAGWTAADVARVRAAIGPHGNAGRCGWIEQAAMLARGETTAHARRIGRDAAALVTAPTSEPRRDPAFAIWLARQTSELPLSRVERTSAPAEPTAETPDVEADALPAAEAQLDAQDEAQDEAKAETETETESEAEANQPATAGPAAPPLPVPTVEVLATGEDGADARSPKARPPKDVPAIATPAEPSEGGSTSEPEPPEVASPQPPAMPASIAARISALERDLAALEILPLSPPQPRRMVLPPTQVAPPRPAAASDTPEQQRGERSFHNALTLEEPLQLPEGTAERYLVDDRLEPDLGEADVTIIRQATREIGLDPIVAPPPRTPAGAVAAAGRSGDEFDRDEYAAYRERVEEAIVEIVAPAAARSAPAVRPPQAKLESSAEKPIDRFLKALKGS